MKKFVSVFCLLFVAVAMMAATSHVKHVTAIGEVLGESTQTILDITCENAHRMYNI